MKMTYILFSIVLFASNTEAGNIFDDTLNATAGKFFNQKVSEIYEKALQCRPLEIDMTTGETAREWMEIKPAIPDWRMLKDMQSVAYEARDYASGKRGRDKAKHCYAGCFITKKLDFKSAVMVGWLKELSDATDCTDQPRFEKADYLATVAGAIAGINHPCESFCGRYDVNGATGNEMLEKALKENHITFRH